MFEFLEHYGEKVLDKLLPEVALKAVKTFSKGTSSHRKCCEANCIGSEPRFGSAGVDNEAISSWEG